jgi:RNA ligase
MNFFEYLGISKDEFQSKYLDTGLVQESLHDDFPLALYTYGRKTVADNAWDDVTRKTRGIIVNAYTYEIVARPFEKFFNLGTAGMPETELSAFDKEPDYILEKLDGFLCTLYYWEGRPYIASKGSFHSMHAKWATKWYQDWSSNTPIVWPDGYTPVFEGITPNLRIVVDYKSREELVLLALINNETGEELDRATVQKWAAKNQIGAPLWYPLMTARAAAKLTLDPIHKNTEGYVFVWHREGKTPFRLKVKYQDYFRIHRLISGTSPRRVYEILSQDGGAWRSELDALLNDSNPWFNKYVSKWKIALEAKFDEIKHRAETSYAVMSKVLFEQAIQNSHLPTRKDWALMITRPEFKEIAPVLFDLLDGKKPDQAIWKLVKPLIKNGKPMIEFHSL